MNFNFEKLFFLIIFIYDKLNILIINDKNYGFDIKKRR